MKLSSNFNNILFSIIIPIHNAEKTLNRCINSISKQNFSKLEIILINDGSNDKSKNICNSYNKKLKNIRVFNHKKKLGVSVSRNKGIKKAQERHVLY